MYGDMCGALDPIGDLFKTRVYELSRFMNERFDGIIPEASITKAPSAELRPDQKDTDSLPPYELLDAVLGDYIERGHSVEQITAQYAKSPLAKGQAPTWVKDTLRKLEMNEYKRRQAAPCLKVSTKAFGIGRRIPIAKIWDQ
jgi:NAD+ synthetase